MSEFAAWKIRRRFCRGCIYCCVWLAVALCMQVGKVQWLAPVCILIAAVCFLTLVLLVVSVIMSVFVLATGAGKKCVELNAPKAKRIPFSDDITNSDKEWIRKRGGSVVVQKIPFVGKCVVEVKK